MSYKILPVEHTNSPGTVFETTSLSLQLNCIVKTIYEPPVELRVSIWDGFSPSFLLSPFMSTHLLLCWAKISVYA